MSGKARALRWVIALGCALLLAVGLGFSALLSPDPPPAAPKELRMPTSNVLVIYYSRTGTTQKLAEAIAKATNADLEPLTDTVNRKGFGGFMRSLMDTFRRRGSTLNPLGVDPTGYDLVVIGTPDWGKSVAAPVRTFLGEHQGKLRRVAFFLTDGTTDHAAVFRDMASMVGAEPVAVLGVPQADVVADRYAEKLAAFVKALPAAQPVPQPREPALVQ